MRAWNILLVATGATAQSVAISYVYTATFTETAWEYFSFTTCPCPPSTTGFLTTTSAIGATDNPGLFSTTSTSTSTSTSVTTTSIGGLTDNPGLFSTTSSSTSVTTTSFAVTDDPGSLSGSLSTTSLSGQLVPSDTITPSSPIPTFTTSSVAPPSSPPAESSSTTSAGPPVVTDDAYIATILRHHNIHRTNHTADPLVWNPAQADIARQIAETCIYGHVTNINGGGYGQNIGAGYPATPLGMGSFITEGLYNGEVNSYVYFGMEPDLSTFGEWGHFTQIVWKSSSSVGCYTADCSATGLVNAGPPIPPYFTVCNYEPAGNFVGSFAANVGVSVGLPTVHADY